MTLLRRLQYMLVLSLAVNLLLIGYVAGQYWHDSAEPKKEAVAFVDPPMQLMRIIKTFSPEGREIAQATLLKGFMSAMPKMQEGIHVRTEMGRLVSQETIDEKLLDERMKHMHMTMCSIIGHMQPYLTNMIAELPLEDRLRMVSVMQSGTMKTHAEMMQQMMHYSEGDVLPIEARQKMMQRMQGMMGQPNAQ